MSTPENRCWSNQFITIELQHTDLMCHDLGCAQALKSSSDEFARILDIVSRYAVYKAGVAFSCKRQVHSLLLSQANANPRQSCRVEVKLDCTG